MTEIFILLLFFSGETLNCHRCVPQRAGGECELTEETCKPEKNGCAAARFLRKPCEFFQHTQILNT